MAIQTRALEPVGRAGIGKPYRPNFILAWIYRLFFSKIDVDPEWVAAVREASAAGTVVYVMRSVSYLDFVALDFFLKRFDLPLIRFVTDLGLWILEPIGPGLRQFFSPRAPEGPALTDAVAAGFSALFFMRRPQSPTSTPRRGGKLEVDHVRILIDQQRRQERPILLFPQVLVFGKKPDTVHKGVVDQLFGSREYPRNLRIFAQLLWHYGNVKLRACEPLNLKELIAEHAGLDDAALVNKIHWLMITRLDRERRVVLGPRTKGPDRLQHEVLRHPRVREAIEDTARRENRPVPQIEANARKEIERLGARMNPLVLTWVDRACHWLFHRIYRGVEVDREGLQRVRERARRGPIVLLPSHKSHIDYILLSYIFFEHGLECPLIAAGDNLAFWPAGPLLRRCGAFFIRRSFKGARLYTALVDTYVRKLLREGHALEFFLEGGRSRTGKLLPPKAGLLSMVADAADGVGAQVAYVPVSIGYERVVEQGSYVEEMSGAEKKKEDAAALLKAPRVLTATYGRAYVQFGEIQEFAFSDAARGQSVATEGGVASARSAKRAALERAQARRAEVAVLARRVMYEIDRATPVTPVALVATVLLGVQRHGLSRDALLTQLGMLIDVLRAAGARFAGSLTEGTEAIASDSYRVDAIDQAINLFVDSGSIQVRGPADEAIYLVPDEKRLGLDFYKNNLIHFLVPRALLACALFGPPGPRAGISLAALRTRVGSLRLLLAGEFNVRADEQQWVDQALEALIHERILVRSGGDESATISLTGAPAEARLAFYAGVLRNFLESYRVAARALGLLRKGPMPAKDLSKRALELGERMFLTGEISRREALSTPNFTNAFSAFREAGYVLGGDAGTQRLAAGYDSPEALAAIEARITPYLAGS